ncbi:MAG TPA: hypothetical protein VK176_03160, partial [Phycisphaerales bacterium]|nr:hypothetical protein [Phycisphaerales bacterium]
MSANKLPTPANRRPRLGDGRGALARGRAMALIAGVAVACTGIGSTVHANEPWVFTVPRTQPAPGLERQTTESLVATLRDATAAPAARSEAATVLAQRAVMDPAELAAVEGLLEGAVTESSPGWFMLGGLSRQPSIPESMAGMIESALGRADDRSTARALSALAGVRTREAARTILNIGRTADRAESVRRAAWAALAKLSGRTDLADNADAWRQWLDRAESYSREEWAEMLAQGMARRADFAETGRQTAITRLVEAYRRVHVSLPPEQRSEFLAGLMRDDIDEVRSLGFELVLRELSENARLGTAVEAAAIALLDSPTPSVRERAGLLVAQLNPASARGPVVAALEREADPAAAAALLRAATRWPDEGLLGVALGWVDSQSAAMPSGVDYIRQLLRAGFLQGAETRELVLQSLRQIPPERTAPGSCDIFVHIGTEDDVRTVARLLSQPSGAIRLAAAQALMNAPEHIDDILLAAQKDPELFEVASRAVSMYWATAEGFRSVASLRAPSQEAWRRGLLRIAELMPAPDIVAVAQTVEPSLREPILSNLASANRILSERLSTATFEALGAGLVELAKLRVTQDKPDGALAALDAMQELPILMGEDAV